MRLLMLCFFHFHMELEIVHKGFQLWYIGFNCLFWFPSCKGCCLKLSVCCGKCKRCQCCKKDNDDDGWVRDQNGNWFNRNERNDNKKKPTKRIDYKTDSMVRSVKRNNREQLEYLEQKGIIT